jgi:alkylation response protein AidB-like acyl-CoA dehydrogenase
MAGGELSDANSIVEAARALRPRIRAAADEIERARRLPMHVVEELRRIGAFRMTMPLAWGGPELDPLSQLRVIEELSVADASVGWCTMIGSDGGYFTAFLDDAVGRGMYRDLDAATGSSLVFTGRAEASADGYRVSGRWPFVSGCQHSQWIVAHCIVHENGTPRRRADGLVETRMCYLPRERGEILDTWHTTGLRGSGSHDFTVADLFVPREQTFTFQDAEVARAGPLYAYPWMFVCNLPAVAIGIARGAIESFIETACNRRPTVPSGVAGRSLLRDEPYVQSAIGQAEALAGSARSYVYDALGEMWATLAAGREPTASQRARVRLSMVHAHTACTQAVDLIFKAAGGTAVYARSPLDRALRDMHTINQHTITSLRMYEAVGRVLAGLDARNEGF